MKFRYFLQLLRPHQWTKNLIIFAALIFSKHLLDPSYILLNTYGLIVFCFLSGSVYIFNDLVDREKDKLHPKKRNRPLASGLVKPAEAASVGVIISVASLAMAFYLNIRFGFVALFYFSLIVIYSLLLKKIVILDVLTISLGFVTRAVAGGVLIDVEISNWLLIVTIFLALFLGFSKRRSEMVNLDKNAGNHRPILDSYSLPLLDQLITITAAATLLAYSLYTQAQQTILKFGGDLWVTIPIVVYIIFRYFYIVYVLNKGGSPSRLLLSDRPLLAGVGVWLITVLVVVYWASIFS